MTTLLLLKHTLSLINFYNYTHTHAHTHTHIYMYSSLIQRTDFKLLEELLKLFFLPQDTLKFKEHMTLLHMKLRIHTLNLSPNQHGPTQTCHNYFIGKLQLHHQGKYIIATNDNLEKTHYYNKLFDNYR